MRDRKLDSGWLAARSTEISLSGVELTTTHPPSQPTKPWMEGVVPGTVLGTLLKNKLIGDPFYGLVNESIIDIADSGREYYTFWFFTRFQASLSVNTHAWLNFRGINYSADVYLNGHKKVLPKGMFRRHTLDVTDMLHSNGDNYLAVLVYPPDHPGRIPTEGGQGGDHEIGKDVATQYVEGWDWMTPIRDRNTGIWDQVSLTFSGPVKISDPHLVSSFFDDLKRVYLHTTAEFTNVSPLAAECTLRVQVALELEDGVCLIEQMETKELSIPAGNSILYTFSPLFFYRPSLWWPKGMGPNGMGKQTLYKVDITVDVKDYGESDSWSHPFGFRKIESYIDSATGGRLFKVNGEPVFIRGGNWIVSDGLLRLSEKRYEEDIKFHADMNFNMIRCWGGGLAERPEFYHYCDLYGLLVWQEFWITGDVDGRGIPVSNPNGPLDHELFLICARDTVKLLRNHASLALWVGGNEQHPPDDINAALKNDLQLHPYLKSPDIGTNLMNSHTWPKASEDPSRYLDGTRVYIQGSLWDGFASGDGEFTDGPYNIQNPEDFFKDDFYKYGFNPEVGSVGMPLATTIRATMPPEAWQIPLFQKLPSGYIKEVPNPVWDYHKYIPYSNPGTVHDQIEMYGEPKSLDDFCEKAQLVNYVQYKALLEGWTSRMWTKYTGVLIWKTQNPWTGLRGQFYDHLHEQTAGFYGVRSAAEPIHVQLNLASYFIEIVNTTSSPLSNVTVEASVWDLEGTCPYHKINKIISVPSKITLPVFEMQYPKSHNAKPVYFLLLKLLDTSAKLLSRNFYWLHLPGGNYKLLETYRSKKVPIRSTTKVNLVGNRCTVKIKVQNTSNKSVSECHSLPNFEDRDNQHEPISIENNCEYGSMNVEEPATETTEGLLSRVSSLFSRKNKNIQVTETKGDHAGVAFLLNFSVIGKRSNSNSETHNLTANYSDNYLSPAPGEVLPVDIDIELPPNTVPQVVLKGWNTNEHHLSMQMPKL